MPTETKSQTKRKTCYPENAELLDIAEEFSAAADRDAPYEELLRIARKIKASPDTAKYMKRVYGKEMLKEMKLDFTLADAEFGEGWLDEPDEKR